MNANAKLVVLAFVMFLLDLPWLSFIGGNYSAIVQAIQGGREVRMRPIAGVVVYPALAFLALKTTSLKDAFLTGAAVYAVYDFTVLAAFKDYPIWMAVADTVWGGTLFSLVFWLREYFAI
jgi:uncharacterized membrane protein